MFNIGSYVSYRSEGVCKISDIRKENFGVIGKDTLYYVLTPLTDEKSVFFVPVDNDNLVSMMRKLLDAEEITSLVKHVTSQDTEWIENSKLRINHFREIFAAGEREELIRLIHTVKLHTQLNDTNGKKSYITDINAMKRAARILFDEFSMMLDLKTPDEVIDFIENISTENKKSVSF